MLSFIDQSFKLLKSAWINLKTLLSFVRMKVVKTFRFIVIAFNKSQKKKERKSTNQPNTSSDFSVIYGAAAADLSGRSVSSCGDVNNDGVADLIIGAPFADPPPGRADAGITHVVYGNKGGIPETIDLAALKSSEGSVIYGAAAADLSGRSVSSCGDVNNNGIADLIIGARDADPPITGRDDAGRTYVVYGVAVLQALLLRSLFLQVPLKHQQVHFQLVQVQVLLQAKLLPFPQHQQVHFL
jgi:hypothetical protein